MQAILDSSGRFLDIFVDSKWFMTFFTGQDDPSLDAPICLITLYKELLNGHRIKGHFNYYNSRGHIVIKRAFRNIEDQMEIYPFHSLGGQTFAPLVIVTCIFVWIMGTCWSQMQIFHRISLTANLPTSP